MWPFDLIEKRKQRDFAASMAKLDEQLTKARQSLHALRLCRNMMTLAEQRAAARMLESMGWLNHPVGAEYAIRHAYKQIVPAKLAQAERIIAAAHAHVRL